jgi:hypothetical protein
MPSFDPAVAYARRCTAIDAERRANGEGYFDHVERNLIKLIGARFNDPCGCLPCLRRYLPPPFFAETYSTNVPDGLAWADGRTEFAWSVEKARPLIEAAVRANPARPAVMPIALSPEDVMLLSTGREFYPPHVDHIPAALFYEPGIAATLDSAYVPYGGGPLMLELIDGMHRALRSAREGKDFVVWVLSPADSLLCQPTTTEVNERMSLFVDYALAEEWQELALYLTTGIMPVLPDGGA